MAKKIGIVTGFDMSNYGNRLQNYAVQATLNKMGYESDTLVPAQKIYPNFKTRVKSCLLNTACLFGEDKFVNRQPRAVRYYRFGQFNKNINITPVPTKDNFFPESLSDKYDYFVAGSDQVWNPFFWEITLGSSNAGANNFLLQFAKENQRKCFSPSFGISSLPDEYAKYFSRTLGTFSHIGVREHDGAKIVQDVAGRSAEVTLDPTLLLDKEEWAKVESNTYTPENRYILFLFLGTVSEEVAPEQMSYLKSLASRKKLKFLQMGLPSVPNLFACGPGEFLHMINNAELVCTDSYHCAIFSFLYNKPFILFDRIYKRFDISMSSRTRTLLELLDLERKAAENIVWDDECVFEYDYSLGMKNLAKARENTLEFLEASFA